MKKTTLAAIALALPLSIGSAWAVPTTLGSFTHNYGNGIGQVAPYGSDALNDGFVTVSDWSSNRFKDTFDLKGLSSGSIDSFVLTLTYSDVYGGITGLLEQWYVRPGGAGSPSNSAPFRAFKLADSGNATKTVEFTFDSGTTTFTSMAENKSFYYLFAEQTTDIFAPDKFKLYSAKLEVTGTAAPVPEPESYAMLLAGLALMGPIARRRNKNS